VIIEFIGLPGAGKTSLERALLAEIKRRGRAVMSRAEAVEALASVCSPFSRDRGVLLRRLSTLCYKLSLIREFIALTGELLVCGDLLHLHRMRAAMRVVEDLRLHRLGGSAQMAGRILNLSEGLGQHLIALWAWRGLLGPARKLKPFRDLVSSHFSANSLLIHIVVPEAVAAARLHARGVPPLWPVTAPPKDVLQAFAEAGSSLSAFFAVNECVRVVRLDGDVAQPDWHLEAASIANLLPSNAEDDLAGRHGS